MRSWHGNLSPLGSWHSSRGGATLADQTLGANATSLLYTVMINGVAVYFTVPN
jgi:hypothetical protein